MEKKYYIISDKTNFAKSILKTSKSVLINSFTKSMIEGSYKNSLEYALELIFSGYYDIFWDNIFLVIIEYINIHNPKLIIDIYKKREYFYKILNKASKKKNYNTINLRNLFEIQKIVIYCVKNITFSAKKHIGIQIKKYYNVETQIKTPDDKQIFILLKNFKLHLNHIISSHVLGNNPPTSNVNSMYKTLGNLLSINSMSIALQDNNITLYHHTRGKHHISISTYIWNIILTYAQKNESIKKYIKILYILYTKKTLFPFKKQPYIILISLLFLTKQIKMSENFNIDIDDINILTDFIKNTQLFVDGKIKKTPTKKKITKLDMMTDRDNTNDLTVHNKKDSGKQITIEDGEDEDSSISGDEISTDSDIDVNDVLNCSFLCKNKKTNVNPELDDKEEDEHFKEYHNILFDFERIPLYKENPVEKSSIDNDNHKNVKLPKKYNQGIRSSSKYKIFKVNN